MLHLLPLTSPFSPNDGDFVVGPFASEQEALDYRKKHLDEYDIVFKLIKPLPNSISNVTTTKADQRQ